MSGDLDLRILAPTNDKLGFVAGFVVTDEMIVAIGGTSSSRPIVFGSPDARTWQTRSTPWDRGLRDVLVVGDSLWVCGEWGQLAVSRDLGASWQPHDTKTDCCLYGVALGHDGAIWVVGDNGYAARVHGQRVQRLDLNMTTRLEAVYSVRDEIVMLGHDGQLRRIRDGKVTQVACGTVRPITALAVTAKNTWIVVGDGGFIARSPDGTWYSKVSSTTEADLEAVTVLPDGSVIAVGDRGTILRSTDDGRTWRSVPHATKAHLWAVERFGSGVLIGGEHGYIARLSAPGDTTWADRYVPPTLESLFASGPNAWVERGLGAYLDVMGLRPDAPAATEETDELATFEALYGVAMPREAQRYFDITRGASRDDSFVELRVDRAFDRALRAAGDRNVFEQMIVESQRDTSRTDLVEAFSGVFGVGSQSNGDSYHLELYAWDKRRQVLHHDAAAATLAVTADSLDSLVYLGAVLKAGDERRVGKDTVRSSVRMLHRKVLPTWHFGIEQRDPDFVPLQPDRRDSESFYRAARWLVALLANAQSVDELADLFEADVNPATPEDRLEAHFRSFQETVPAALYWTWRAFVFGEPELPRYLELAAASPSRIVRDAGALVAELRAGRNELGTIRDVRAHLEAFRALDLDPRRAAERAAAAAAHAAEIAARLEETPAAQWKDLAWQWLDDGVAHRALLERLADSGQLRGLSQIRELPAHERELALANLAPAISPELEAILVGSLVRGDDLEPEETEDDEAIRQAPGWQAIDDALRPLYGDTKPMHYGTVLPYMLGGNDPIHGISVYARTEPVPHWHFVTYGFTDLFQKETDDPEESGFGFELTFRLAKLPGVDTVPAWALNFLQNLGRYVFGTGNRFATGHKMGLNGPIALDTPTKITAVCFADDPELGEFRSRFGAARFVQIVGITDDEYKVVQEWSTTGLLEILTEKLPLLVTDLDRGSVLDDAATAALVQQRVSKEGSSEDLTFAGELGIEVDDGSVRLELGALYAAALPRAMRGRIRHGRPYELRGKGNTLKIEPSAQVGYRREDGDLVLELTQELASEIEAQLAPNLAGAYRFEAWPALEIVVTPSFIRSQDGDAIEVRGIADAATAERMLAEENARIAAGGDDDGEDDYDDEDDDGDDAPPSPEKVKAALALSERAIRMSPHDTDVQFTHSMLLLDADRAGLTGKASELLSLLPQFAPSVRINVAVRMGELEHPRFGDVVDLTLGSPLPEQILADRTTTLGGGAAIASFGDVAHELFAELGEAILSHAPEKMQKLVPLLPAEVNLLSELAWKSIQAKERDAAIALYDRVLSLPIPDEGDDRTNYLRALNNACVQAHAAKAFDAAVRIADRAQPVAHENPYIFHSAACAYAAVGDFGKALDQVRKAIEHRYDHLAKIEVDTDLGALLESPEFKALFRDWHARQEGN